MQAEYKLTLPSLDETQATPLAAERLREARATLGFMPNIYGVMANSPGLIDTCIHGYERFRVLSGFTPVDAAFASRTWSDGLPAILSFEALPRLPRILENGVATRIFRLCAQ